MGEQPPVPGWQRGADGNWYPASSPDFVAPEVVAPPHEPLRGPTPEPPRAAPASPAGPASVPAASARFGVINPGGPTPTGPTTSETRRDATTPRTTDRSALDAPAPTSIMWVAEDAPSSTSAAPDPPRAVPPPTPTSPRPAPPSAVKPVTSGKPAGTPARSSGGGAAAFFELVKMVVVILIVGAVAAFGYSYYNSTTKATTKSEVCAGLEDLRTQVHQGNGVFGNPLFREAKSLGSKAKRYPDNAKVRANGEALTRIGESSSTSVLELSIASESIASMCGKSPLLFKPMIERDGPWLGSGSR